MGDEKPQPSPSKSAVSHPDHPTDAPRYIQIARSVPLSVAMIAPVITLLDIPALSMRWYRLGTRDGPPLDDPVASVAMSVISLVFCAVGNFLLIVRFSSGSRKGTEALLVQAPTLAYWIKTIVEVVNLSVYGGRRSQADGQQKVYSEGFWSAVFSCFLSGICAILLLYHYIVQKNRIWKDSQKIRVEGRHFMLSILSFVFVVGIEGLIFSKIEGWYYFDGLYFSIVTVLTIGFGDFVATKTSTRVLLFPFSLVGISLLGYLVSMIISYFTHRTNARRRRWAMERRLLAHRGRRALLDAQQAEHNRFLPPISLSNPFGKYPLHFNKIETAGDNESRKVPEPTNEWSLKEEMAFLESIQQREKQASQTWNIVTSLSGFLSFWVVGSAIFSRCEGWTYGNSLYFSYVFFFSTGYGDFSPESAFGRVFFILWSLMAVPVVASLAVQTLTNLIEAFSERHLQNTREKRVEASDNETPVRSHSEMISEYYGKCEERIEKELEAGDREEEEGRRGTSGGSEADSGDRPRRGTRSRELERELTKHVLELATLLEAQARGLLVSALPSGGKCQTLLRADRNVQKRDVMLLNSYSNNGDMTASGSMWDDDEFRVDMDESSRLEAIHRYRTTFSQLLVAGAELRQLEFPERGKFLRTSIVAHENGLPLHGLERAEREMELMDEADGDLEVEGSDGEQTVEVPLQGKGEKPKKGKGTKGDRIGSPLKTKEGREACPRGDGSGVQRGEDS